LSTCLRPTTAADLAFVTALERDPANNRFIGQWSDEEHLEAIAGRARREHWIIERDGRPAGYLIAYDGRDRAAGIYVKRLLVADKERGTGKAALAAFLDAACARPGADHVWLQVFDWNARAQAVYVALGMRRYDPSPEEAARLDRTMDAGREGVSRMRIDASAWKARSPAR